MSKHDDRTVSKAEHKTSTYLDLRVNRLFEFIETVSDDARKMSIMRDEETLELIRDMVKDIYLNDIDTPDSFIEIALFKTFGFMPGLDPVEIIISSAGTIH